MPLIGTISDIGGQYEEFVKGINTTNEALNSLQSQISGFAKTATQNGQQISAMIDALTTNMTGLGKEAGNIANALNGISSALKQGRQHVEHHTSTIDEMWEAYKKMGIEVDKLSDDLKSLNFAQKEINKVVQLGNEYNQERNDTYVALSERYRAMKILIDNMTKAEREETDAGRQLVAESLKIYEQMNQIQQSTGKFQLQVGNYEKTMNGMRIATTQVVRELPVLANGVTMFAIAISNNIPIFAESIAKANEEYQELMKQKAAHEEAAEAARAAGKDTVAAAEESAAAAIKATPPLKAIVTVLKGWQTWLVIILSVLPAVIRNIEKKKKAQEEANKVTREAIEYEKELTNAYRSGGKQVGQDIAKLDSLYRMSNDLNRSMEERIKIAEAMKLEYKDEFANFSAEEIALGKASGAYNTLRDSIIEVAKARAYQNKITEYTSQQLELKVLQDQAQKAKDDAEIEIKRLQGLQPASPLSQFRGMVQPTAGYAEAETESDLKKAEKARDEAQKTINETGEQMQELDNLVKKLEDDIPVNGVIGALVNGLGSGGAGANATNIPDYYLQVLEATASLMEEGVEKDLAMLEIGWLKEQKGLNDNLKALTDMRANANAEELVEINNQIDNVVKLMQLGESKYRQERMRVVNESLHTYEEVVEQEIDLDEEKRKSVERNLKQEQFERNQAYYREYELSQRTQSDREKLNEQLVDSERQYWEDYLATLRDMEILLPHEYEKIMAALSKGQEKHRNRRNRFGGVFEAGMAMFTDWGEERGGVRVLKDEYKDFTSAVDNALKTSMNYMDEWMDKRLEMAEIAVEAAEKEVEAAKTTLDYELEARNQGYANSVETARKELDIQRQNHKKALEEKAKVEEQQRMIDTATQISSLVTATANIWSAYTKAGMLGPFLAAAATAAMWGAFAAAQTKAAQVTKMKSQQYGEGTVELLEGGSHASGRDIDMGVAKDGTRRRAEGGEFFAIINKRNSRKYRKIIPDVINSFNDGTFGEKYYNANAAMGDFALGLLAGGSPTDVSKLERDVRAIREQGDENRYVDSMGNMVIRYKNLTRKYRKG